MHRSELLLIVFDDGGIDSLKYWESKCQESNQYAYKMGKAKWTSDIITAHILRYAHQKLFLKVQCILHGCASPGAVIEKWQFCFWRFRRRGSIFGTRKYRLTGYRPMMEMGKIRPTVQSLTRYRSGLQRAERETDREIPFQKPFSISGVLKTCISFKISGSSCSRSQYFLLLLIVYGTTERSEFESR
jgi:hypothetical protein